MAFSGQNWGKQVSGGEEDMLDQVFHCCDKDGTGRVKASKIVDFLQVTANNSEPSAFVELKKLLDPQDKDPELSLCEYQSGIALWIRTLQEHEDEGSNEQPGLGTSGCFEEDKEGNDLSRSWDSSELLQRVYDLRREVQRLTDENRRLGVIGEEENVELASEVSALRRRISEHQLALSKQPGMDEYDALRSAVLEEQQHVAVLQARTLQLEHEKAMLHEKLTTALEGQADLQAQVERLQESRNVASNFLDTQPNLAVVKEHLGEVVDRSAQLEQQVAELTAVCKQLRTDKQLLERELEDLFPKGARTPLSVASNDCGDSLLRQLSGSMVYGSPMKHSTPVKPMSTLHYEVVKSGGLGSGETAEGLESPIVGCVQDDLVPTLNRTGTSENAGPDQWSSHSSTSLSVSPSESTNQLKCVFDQVRERFHMKKRLALKQISDISDISATEGESGLENNSGLDEEARASLLQKLSKVIKSRKTALKKVASLEKQVQSLQEEIKELRSSSEFVRTWGQTSEAVQMELVSLKQEHAAALAELETCQGQIREQRLQINDLLAQAEAAHSYTDDHDSTLGTSCSSSLDSESLHLRLKSLMSVDSSISMGSRSPIWTNVSSSLDSDEDLVADGLSTITGAFLRKTELFLQKATPNDVEKHYLALSVNFRNDCETIEQQLQFRMRAVELAEQNLLDVLQPTGSETGSGCNSQLMQHVVQRAMVCAKDLGSVTQQARMLTSIKVLAAHINNLRSEIFYLQGKDSSWPDRRLGKAVLSTDSQLPSSPSDSPSSSSSPGSQKHSICLCKGHCSSPLSLRSSDKRRDSLDSRSPMTRGDSVHSFTNRRDCVDIQSPDCRRGSMDIQSPDCRQGSVDIQSPVSKGDSVDAAQSSESSPVINKSGVFTQLNTSCDRYGFIFSLNEDRGGKAQPSPTVKTVNGSSCGSNASSLFEEEEEERTQTVVDEDLILLREEQEHVQSLVSELRQRASQVLGELSGHSKQRLSSKIAECFGRFLLWVIFVITLLMVITPLLCPLLNSNGQCSCVHPLLDSVLGSHLSISHHGLAPA